MPECYCEKQTRGLGARLLLKNYIIGLFLTIRAMVERKKEFESSV